MMTYYRTDDQVIHEEEKLSDGVWVQMINPTHDECEEIAEKLMVDIDDVKAALDVEESSRIELQDGYTLILVDIPAIEIRHDQRTYTTIPLGIILTQDIIVTICTEDTPVLQNFVRSRVKEFSTKKKLRFVYQILYRTAAIYQANLRIIDKRRTEIEERVGSDTDDSDLINLHELESTLVYFATSLRANGVVLDRLTRYKRLEQYPEDKELLDDVQHCGFTTTGRTIENHELLNRLGIAIDNRTDTPLDFLSLLWRIECLHQLIIGVNVSRLQHIRESLGRIAFLFDWSVRKYQLFIQRVVVIPHLTLTILVPVVNHARFSVPHVEHPVIIQMLLVFVRVNIQLMVNQLKSILFVNAPQSSLFQPDSVEIRTPNHQVLGLFDDEFGIDFDYTAFSRARCNH